MNMFTFDGVQPEELLALLRNFKIAIDGIGTTTPTGRINYLLTIVGDCGKTGRKNGAMECSNIGARKGTYDDVKLD